MVVWNDERTLFAVPTAVGKLVPEETAREALRGAPEVGAECERAPVDTWLHFALEERLARLVAELLVPLETRLEAGHRRFDDRVGAVDTGRAQEQEREERWQPVGCAGPVPRAVRPLAGENFGAHPFARDAGALPGEHRRGGVRKVAHSLPTDGRVRIEQPVDGVHGATLCHRLHRTCN